MIFLTYFLQFIKFDHDAHAGSNKLTAKLAHLQYDGLPKRINLKMHKCKRTPTVTTRTKPKKLLRMSNRIHEMNKVFRSWLVLALGPI